MEFCKQYKGLLFNVKVIWDRFSRCMLYIYPVSNYLFKPKQQLFKRCGNFQITVKKCGEGIVVFFELLYSRYKSALEYLVYKLGIYNLLDLIFSRKISDISYILKQELELWKVGYFELLNMLETNYSLYSR